MSVIQYGDASDYKQLSITVCGTCGVGKSATVVQFVASKYFEDYDPTIEDCYRHMFEAVSESRLPLELRSKQFAETGSERVLFEVLDTTNYESENVFQNTWIQQCNAFILMFDVTRSVA